MKPKTITYIFLSLFLTISTLLSCNKETESPKGEVVFWKFTDNLNCGPIEVKVYLNTKTIGALNNDFQPYDSIPNCGDEHCLTVKKPIGEYDYKAECYCGTSKNLIGYWTGTLIVKQDSCTKIFFDIEEMIEQ